MLYKTPGIVLNYIKYKESSIIVKIYTLEFGLQSYIINSVRSKKAKSKIALYQPLTLLELVVYNNDKKNIQRLSEVRCAEPLRSIPFDILKSSVAIFLSEVMAKTLREEEKNQALFLFLYHAILELDKVDRGIENFHLKFLYDYSEHMGIQPIDSEELLLQLDSLGNKQVSFIPTIDFIAKARYLLEGVGEKLEITVHDRRHLLSALVAFYYLHFDHIKEFKSAEVLKEVLS